VAKHAAPAPHKTLRNGTSESGETPVPPFLQSTLEACLYAQERKLHTRWARGLNYELERVASSLFRKSGRARRCIGEVFQDQFEDLNDFWKQRAKTGERPAWSDALAGPEISDWKESTGDVPARIQDAGEGMADTACQRPPKYYEIFRKNFVPNDDEENLYKEEPFGRLIYSAFYDDLNGPTAAQSKLTSGPASC